MIPAAVYRQTLFAALEPLKPLLDDPNVSEILVNGPSEVYYEQRGRLERSGVRFSSLAALDAALTNLAQYVGRPLSQERPILEGHLPDGSRVEAVIPPASPAGPIVAIRRFSKTRLSLNALIERGTLDADLAGRLGRAVASHRNVLVSGGTGSGKTSLLTALSACIDPRERIVLMEDARELVLEAPHVVRLLTCPPDARGHGQITMRDLLRAALRLRPDRIVVGEVRGGEAVDLVQAMTSGHAGCLSTVHASSSNDALRRLEAMALLAGAELPLPALRAQIASAIHLVVQIERRASGARVVSAVHEITGIASDGDYALHEVFWRQS